jgi:site-specific DNA-methyltransferase (adenine-specific)
MNKVYHGDCLEVMDKLIQDGVKVDTIITDPPYGSTNCKWDKVIDFNEVWIKLKEIRKDKAITALFGVEPFSSYLRMSNIKEFKYDWIWNKKRPANFPLAKFVPLKITENISIFSCYPTTKNQFSSNKVITANYFPQGLVECHKKVITSIKNTTGKVLPNATPYERIMKKTGYPNNIIEIKQEKGKVHPTQKPVALLEYLIKTYTNENDLVLDFTAGSGTTAVACINTNRQYIVIEKEKKYIDIINERIEKATKDNSEMLFK